MLPSLTLKFAHSATSRPHDGHAGCATVFRHVGFADYRKPERMAFKQRGNRPRIVNAFDLRVPYTRADSLLSCHLLKHTNVLMSRLFVDCGK